MILNQVLLYIIYNDADNSTADVQYFKCPI